MSRPERIHSYTDIIADSTRPLALYESGFAPRWYVPRADAKSPRRIDDSDRADQIIEVGQRFAHSHEHDVVDLLAALAFDRDDLIDNFVRL